MGLATDPCYWQSPGRRLPSTARVMVRYFAGLTDSEIIADQANPGFLENAFVAFGPGGAVGEEQGNRPFAGRFIFSTSATVEPPSPTFIAPSSSSNQQICIWTFDSSNLPTAAAHQAIFTSTLSNWIWPTTDEGFTDTSISLDDSLSMLVGGSNKDSVFMQAIPEPWPWAPFGFGIIGVAGARSDVRRCRVSTCWAPRL